jgi:hypothetical protein
VVFFPAKAEVFDPSVTGGPITKGRGGLAVLLLHESKKWLLE